jgi:2-polyprenyl-6-methoxyphenol hydroxylase-like FAD-dependent oxidoreductase
MTSAIEVGVRVLPGTKITDAIEGPDGVSPIAADGTHLEVADLLVGADGLWSATRQVVDPVSKLRISPFAALWGLGQNDGPCPDRLRQQARGVRVLVGLLPVGPHETAVFWGLRGDEFDAVRAAGLDALMDRVARVFPEACPVLQSAGGFDRLTLARYGHATVRRRHTDRVVLIGDAAHPSPPHLGQGANLALLDAASLADALRVEPTLAAALRRWDRSRRWQNQRYTLLSRAVAPFFQSSHGWLGPTRDVGLPIMTRLPPTRSIMERVLAGRG